MRKKERKAKLKKLYGALKKVYDTEKSDMWRTDVNYSNEKNEMSYAGSHPEETYIKGTPDNLYIADESPSLLVEPDVRQKIRDYFKAMRMI
jgi:hypothetical protein